MLRRTIANSTFVSFFAIGRLVVGYFILTNVIKSYNDSIMVIIIHVLPTFSDVVKVVYWIKCIVQRKFIKKMKLWKSYPRHILIVIIIIKNQNVSLIISYSSIILQEKSSIPFYRNSTALYRPHRCPLTPVWSEAINSPFITQTNKQC